MIVGKFRVWDPNVQGFANEVRYNSKEEAKAAAHKLNEASERPYSCFPKEESEDAYGTYICDFCGSAVNNFEVMNYNGKHFHYMCLHDFKEKEQEDLQKEKNRLWIEQNKLNQKPHRYEDDNDPYDHSIHRIMMSHMFDD